MVLQQSYGQRCVPVNVFALQLSTALKNVERADRGASLGSVVERCFVPLVSDFDLQVFEGTKGRNSLDWVDLS